ncbi:MAG: hypothetical protein IPO95_07495 [Rhodanobacteraceae bacterium]|nr:hypothetical protein [Rhodanobacteraceae bacterium]
MKLTPWFIVAAALGLAQPAGAFKIEDKGLEAKLNQSDVVVLGVIENFDASSKIADVKVLQTLKGRHTPSIRFLADAGIADMRTNCCKPREEYLLFLVEYEDGLYWSVNGKFGAVRIGERKD